MKKNNVKLKKPGISRLFYNNRFVLVFSVVAAILLWLVVALQYSPEEERVVQDVKVKIDLSDYLENAGYKAFGASEYTVDVTVKGKRYLISPAALKSEDISVRANTSYVDSAGNYSLPLIASRVDNSAEFEIVSLSVQNVDVYFDTAKDKEFPVSVDIIAPDGGIAPEGYYVEKDYEITPNRIKISGPASEVNKIAKVGVSINIPEQITSSHSYPGTIVAVDNDGEELKYLTYGTGEVSAEVFLPVYKLVKLNTEVSFVNAPDYYIEHPLRYSVSPSSAEFGVIEDQMNSIENKAVSVAEIDFSELSAGKNELTVKADPELGVWKNSEENQLTVTVFAEDMEEKVISFPTSDINYVNKSADDSSYMAEARRSGSINFVVVGPSEVLGTIDESSLEVTAEFYSEMEEKDSVKLPLTVKVTESDRCWISGSYSVEAKINSLG